MVIVDTKVLLSEHRNGLGLFADQDLDIGSYVFKLTTVELLCYIDSKASRDVFQRWGYYSKILKMYILPKDEGRYIKGALDELSVNLKMDKEGNLYTFSRVRRGEELLSWYPEYMYTGDINKFDNFDSEEKERLQSV